jgi:hypothetical protein
MFFNYDSIEIVAIGFVVSGIFTYFYSTSSPIINNESLVNTNSMPSELSTNLVDVAVQTEVNIPVEAATTYVNTGIQTSARMWVESVRNWITEILGTTSNAQYVDAGVQTMGPSTWSTVKQWFLEVLSVRGSELSSMGYNKVDKWRTGLDSIQSVNLHDSESPLTNMAFGSPNNSSLDKLLDPNDSASNITEVISESNLSLQNVGELIDPTQIALPISNISSIQEIPSVYQINDFSTYNNLLVLPDAQFSQVVIDGVNQYFVVLNNAILSVNPTLMNLFV